MIKENTALSCVIEESAIPVQKSIIWLHGLGADGYDFVSVVPAFKQPTLPGIRFVFPHAPLMPVTINNGYVMRAWFDVYGFTAQAQVDKAGIARSVQRIAVLIEQEKAKGITANNIILAGFSQGAVMALESGLRYVEPLGGIIALSGFLPDADALLATINPANKRIPIFIAHGTEDAVVPYVLGKIASAALLRAGCPATVKRYPIAHTVSAEEITDICLWLQEIIMALPELP